MFKEVYYGWWIVCAAFLLVFYVVGSVAFGFTAFIDPIANEFGWSYTHISVAASLRGLELGVFAPIMGFLVDRFGSKKILFSGSILIAVGYFALASVRSLTMFYAGFLVLGLGASTCTMTVMTPAVANWFKKDLGKALGIMISGAGAGGALIPVISTLIDAVGWRNTYVILGIGMLIVGIPLTLVFRERSEPDAQSAAEVEKAGPNSTAKDPENNFGLKKALRTRIFWHLSIAESLRIMTLMALITHVIPYLGSIGISRVQATLVATFLPMLSIVGRLVAGWLGDKYSKVRVLAALYVLGGISVFIFAYVKNEWLLYLFLILFPLSWGAVPLQGAILRECFGRLALGSIMGLLGGIMTIPRILGPAIAGWTYDTFGQYYLAWLFFTLTFVVSFVLMLTIEPRKK